MYRVVDKEGAPAPKAPPSGYATDSVGSGHDINFKQNIAINTRSLPVASSIIELCIHDHHKVGTDVDSPAEVAGDDHHLHRSRGEQLLHYLTLQLR